MKKDEYIEKYGVEKYATHRKEANERGREWAVANPEKTRERKRNWAVANPEAIKAHNAETHRKGGKRYEQHQTYMTTGVSGEKQAIRKNHAYKWRPYKRVIAPNSQTHHQWIPGTADYRGVALVEADQHLHGFIDVIQILEGEITLFTEAEIRRTI